MRLRLLLLVLAAGVLLAPVAQADETPQAHCRRVGVDDTLRPIPESLVPVAKRLFGFDAPDAVVRRMTVYRCMGGAVLVCAAGANLPCGKANLDRSLASASQYCRDNPDAPFIPMVVTGHDTIYRWRCRGTKQVAGEPVEPVDARGFQARLWKVAA